MIDVQPPDPEASLQRLPLEELRQRRATYLEEETGLSYLRRMVQGPLDIVRSELSRRGNGTGSDLAGLVEDLPNLLAGGEGSPVDADPAGDTVPSGDAGTNGFNGGGVATHGGRPLQMIEPTRVDPELAGELDAVLANTPVASVTQLDEAELSALARQLEDFEKRVSEQRRALHREIDSLQAELTRRYRTGEASVETLLD